MTKAKPSATTPATEHRVYHGIHSAILKHLLDVPEVTTPDEELITSLKGGSAEASHKLFCKHYRYILSKIINITKGRWYSDDLLQAGAVGLYEAATRWDPSRGYTFLTYAHSYIIKRLYMEVRNEVLPLGGLGIGRDEKERLYNYIKFRMVGYTNEQIMKKLHCGKKSLERLSKLNSCASHTCSLNNLTDASHEEQEEDYGRIGTPTIASAENEFLDKDFIKYIGKVITSFKKDTPDIAAVLEREVGVNGFSPMTRKQICKELKMTASEVINCKREGNKLLRKQLIKDGYYEE